MHRQAGSPATSSAFTGVPFANTSQRSSACPPVKPLLPGESVFDHIHMSYVPEPMVHGPLSSASHPQQIFESLNSANYQDVASFHRIDSAAFAFADSMYEHGGGMLTTPLGP